MIRFHEKSHHTRPDIPRKLKNNRICCTKERKTNYEVAIQRMQSILSIMTEKMELAVCLPLLLEHENMPRILKPREMSLFREECSSYRSTWKNLEEDTEELVKDDKHSDEHVFEKFVEEEEEEEEEEGAANAKFMFVLEVLNGNSEVLVLVKKMLKNVSPSASRIIYDMRLLNNLVATRMGTTPEEQREHEEKLCDAAESLKKAEEEINILQTALEDRRAKFTDFATEISGSIERNESTISSIERKLKKDIAKIVNESETQMVRTYKEMLVSQELIRGQIDRFKENLLRTRTINSHREKELRAKRSKVERERATFLAKIDADINERHQSMENLMAESNILTKEQEALQRALEDQKILYNQLQKEKEIVRQKVFDERLENFVKNRAARIMQRAWRLYYERSCSKKKKKSRKKQASLDFKAL